MRNLVQGTHFALTDEQREKLLNLTSDEDRIDYVIDDIEEEAKALGYPEIA